MTCKNNFGADAPSQPIPVLKGRVCGRVSRINAASKAVRWLEGSDAATRMRWQARAEELGVIVPKGGIARENLPKWVPAIARLICDEEGL